MRNFGRRHTVVRQLRLVGAERIRALAQRAEVLEPGDGVAVADVVGRVEARVAPAVRQVEQSGLVVRGRVPAVEGLEHVADDVLDAELHEVQRGAAVVVVVEEELLLVVQLG